MVAALIRRMHEAKVNSVPAIEVWGTGNACREFLSVFDVADALKFLLEHETAYEIINIGRNEEISIRDTAEIIRKVVGYQGELTFDATKPEGRMHMQLNTDRLFGLGWRPQVSLEQAVRDAYEWYLQRGCDDGKV